MRKLILYLFAKDYYVRYLVGKDRQSKYSVVRCFFAGEAIEKAKKDHKDFQLSSIQVIK